MKRAAAVFVGTIVLCASAHAQVFRAYLASNGVDTPSSPCSLQAPCRLLPAALAAVADGGEIWMLDSANYNTAQVNVTRSVTILAVPGALGSVVATNGSAIAVATAGVKLTLRNLVIVPLPGANGLYGISMTAGAGLTVDHCLIANHSQSGIAVTTAAVVRITHSTIRGNVFHGLWVENGARATVTRAVISANAETGIYVSGVAPGTLTTADIADSTIDGSVSGVSVRSQDATAPVKVSIRDSRFTRNANFGMIAQGLASALAASNNMVSNSSYGIAAFDPGTKVWASGNTVSDNEYGFASVVSVFESAGDNAVRNNTTSNVLGSIAPIATR